MRPRQVRRQPLSEPAMPRDDPRTLDLLGPYDKLYQCLAKREHLAGPAIRVFLPPVRCWVVVVHLA
jgi:hypothetical protein